MRNLKKLAFVLSIVIFAGAVSAASDCYVVSATSNTQQQIDQAEQDKKDLEDKLDQNEQELNGLKNDQKNLEGELDNLNQQMNRVVQRLGELEQQISDKEREIAETRAALEEARTTEARQYECMVANVRYMYENGDDSLINSLLKQQSFSDMLNAADYIERIAAYDRKLMDEFVANREYIEQEEARLQRELVELDDLKIQAETERSKVAGLISQTSNAIAKYSDEIEEAERRAAEYEAELKKKEEDLLKVEVVISSLYDYFIKYPEKVPEELQMLMDKDGVDTIVKDYVAGMTDRFAINLYSDLFVPKGWK